MTKKLLALYGLKWNPFAPDVPVEALHVSRRIESFCWRAEQLVGEGGFALVTGAPGTGKSVTLRILAERLGARRDVKVGILTRPQAGLPDFYREMGDLSRRNGDEIGLSVEHRAAPSPKPLTIELAQRGDALALEVADRGEPVTPTPCSLDERITAILASADQPIPFAELRSQVRVRAATLLERIGALCADGRIVKTNGGYRLAST